MGYRRCKAAGASDGSAAGNVDHHDTLDWANLLLEDGGDGRRVDSSGDGDGSSGADGACGCCGDAEAGWRLLMAVTGLTGAARRSRGRLGPLRSLLLRFAQIASSVCADCFFVILSCSYYKTRLGQPSSGRWEEGKEGENPCLAITQINAIMDRIEQPARNSDADSSW